jgi:predicted Zn-dependent protease
VHVQGCKAKIWREKRRWAWPHRACPPQVWQRQAWQRQAWRALFLTVTGIFYAAASRFVGGTIKQPRTLGLALACMMAMPLAGCITEREGNVELPRVAPLPPPSERGSSFETGALREHKRLVASLGGELRAPAIERVANDVLAKLAAASLSDGGPGNYRLTLLNSPSVNAFALPTGHMYVTRGLLALANDTSELAAVLAHEMAHVTANHANSRSERELRSALLSRVASDVLNNTSSSEASQTQSQADLAGFSRAQELEADRIGVRTLAKAGFDPYGAVRFLNSLGRNSASRAPLLTERSGGRQNDFMSTHPTTPERIEAALASARQIAAPGIGQSEQTRYLATLDGLTFGEDPASGVVRGRRYLNPTLKIGFMAPEGFVMEPGVQAVIGVHPSGEQVLRFDRLEANDNTPEQAVASGWIEGVKLDTIESFTANGLAGATATGRGQEWTFRFAAIRSGNSMFRLIFAARNDFIEADRGFRAATTSLRILTTEEASRIASLRVRIVAAQAGDRAESLAARMTGVDRPLERFLILNGLERSQALLPGQSYKIVTD